MKEEHKVAGLLAVALFSQLFLFAVAYSNASWTGEEKSFPDPFAPKNISVSFDNKLNIIADTLNWSVQVAFASSKQPVLAFLGLEGYRYGGARYTSLASQASLNPEVLGAYTYNSTYSSSQ